MVAAYGVVEPVGARQRAEEEEQEREREALAIRERDCREAPVLAVKLSDLAPVADDDAVPLELTDEVVGHRLADVRPPVEKCDDRPAAGEPDGRLAGRVAAADDRDPRAGAELSLGRPGGIEDGQSLELGKPVDRETPVLGARREQDGARGDLHVVLETDEVPAVPRLERERAIRRRAARVELARLADRAARELGAADAGGKAEVVLDAPRRPGLATEGSALDHQRVETFGGAVDRGGEACGAGADDQQVDLLARCELEADSERAQHLAGGRTMQLSSARQPHERRRASVGRGCLLPRVRQSVRARKLDHSHRRFRTVRADDLHADPLHALQCLAPGDERGEERSLSGPSSCRSARSAPRSTAMYRTGSTTSALTKTVWPERRFSSPRKPDAPCLMSSFPAASTIATSPSRIAMNG